jgi:ATP-dependent Lon protease
MLVRFQSLSTGAGTKKFAVVLGTTNHGFLPSHFGQSRSFFWKKGGSSDGPGGGDSNEGGDGNGDGSGNGGDIVQVVNGDAGAGAGGALARLGIGENAPKPPHLLAVPIQRRPLFPGFMAPLVITDEALVEAMSALKKTPAPFVGVFLVNDPNVDLAVDKFSLTKLDQIHRVGTLAHIQQLESGPGGAIAMLMAHRRVLIKDSVNIKTPPLIVRVNHLSQQPLEAVANSDDVKATSNEILATLRDIIKSNPLFQQHVSYFARRIDVSNPYALADFAASLTTADGKELQDVLETMDLNSRLRKALLLLKKEQQLSALQQTIKQDVEKRIDKQQRTWFLMEQLKSIKKELGLEKDDKVRGLL